MRVAQFPDAPWYVIGHSMGAAMATLCALDLKFKFDPQVRAHYL